MGKLYFKKAALVGAISERGPGVKKNRPNENRGPTDMISASIGN